MKGWNPMRRSVLRSGSPIEFVAILIVLAASGASGAILFAIAEGGYSTLSQLAGDVMLPSIGGMAFIVMVAIALHWTWLLRGIAFGFWIGLVSTVGLEVVRIIGFRLFHTMPGDLPTLMGMLLTNRFMQGPDGLSTFLGYAYHFWNGAAFAIPYVLIFGKRPLWIPMAYGVVLGVGFLASPVPNAMGVGYFGVQTGPQFAITVLLAHLLFGTILGSITMRMKCLPSIVDHFWRPQTREKG